MTGTIIIGLIVATALGLAVRSLVRDKKSGKCSCGHNCKSCPGCGRASRQPESPPKLDT